MLKDYTLMVPLYLTSSQHVVTCYMILINVKQILKCLSVCCLSSAQMDVSVVTLFCTQEHGLLLQDCYPKPSGLQALLALDVPYYYFSCKVRTENTLFCLSVVSSVGGGGGFSYSMWGFFLWEVEGRLFQTLSFLKHIPCVFVCTHHYSYVKLCVWSSYYFGGGVSFDQK